MKKFWISKGFKLYINKPDFNVRRWAKIYSCINSLRQWQWRRLLTLLPTDWSPSIMLATMHYLSPRTVSRPLLCAVFVILFFTPPSQAQLTEDAAVSDLAAGLFVNQLIIVSCVFMRRRPRSFYIIHGVDWRGWEPQTRCRPRARMRSKSVSYYVISVACYSLHIADISVSVSGTGGL